MLQIKTNNITILPMRPDAPDKLFSSPDVPHGTDSCIVKALKVARSNGNDVPAPPQFTEEELEAHKTDFVNAIEILPLTDVEGNPISYEEIQEHQVLEPDEETVKKEFYSNYPLDEMNLDGDTELKPRMVQSDDIDMMGEVQKYADLAACKDAILDKAIDDCAQRRLDKAIEECLIVPTLSEEFKAQLELIQVDNVI